MTQQGEEEDKFPPVAEPKQSSVHFLRDVVFHGKFEVYEILKRTKCKAKYSIEVPKTDQSFEERLIFKTFVLKFFNAFTPIIYIAFFRGSKIKKLIRYIQSKQESYQEQDRQKKLQRYETDHFLEPFAGLTPEYMEMRIWYNILRGVAKVAVIINNVVLIMNDIVDWLIPDIPKDTSTCLGSSDTNLLTENSYRLKSRGNPSALKHTARGAQAYSVNLSPPEV
uniref:Anoctamin n=1 Tax=Knipowitschia caucasica TaxID=637954 RepID=A0AAV2KZW9_KNICA